MSAEPFDLDVADRLEVMVHALRAGHVHAVNVTTFVGDKRVPSTMTVHLTDRLGEHAIDAMMRPRVAAEPQQRPIPTRLYGGG
jgi:hypothetical protein